MLSKYAAAAVMLSAATNASPLLSTDDSLVARQKAGSYLPIVGATGGNHPRLEIRELEKTGEMWNLFLLAWAEFQAIDQKVIDSYYQIAGIHGMPWTPWDGVEAYTTPRPQTGYCPHNMLLFGTWHRPYLMLFEQKLQSVAKGIADKFPSATKAKYQDAATKLRVPYWDSFKAVATNTLVYPTAISNEKVKVTFPNGTAATIGNPLYNFKFHPLDNKQINGTGCVGEDDRGAAVCQNSQTTIRPATSELNTVFRNILESQRSSLYTLLSTEQHINSIISTRACGSPRYGSLEGIHGAVHTLHYPGHMAPAGATAFDPLFWLHHSNVDRQIAIWQAIWPETWLNECFAETPTFTIPVSSVNSTTPLTPFHKDAAGTFWNSDHSRYINNLGYTYPELANNPSHSSLISTVKQLYGGSATNSVSANFRLTSVEESPRKYFVQVKLPAYGFHDDKDGSLAYNVLLFAGDVGNDAKTWATSESLVGLASTLGGVAMRQDLTITSLIDVTSRVNSGLKTEGVVKSLKDKLSYRLEIGGKGIEKERVKSLEVELVSSEVRLATSEDTFDTLVGDFIEHGSIDG